MFNTEIKFFIRSFVCPSFSPYVRPSDLPAWFVCPSVLRFVCLSVCLSVRRFVCLFVCLSVRPCVCPSVCSSVRWSVCPSVHACVRASIGPSVRPCAVVSISGSDKYRPSRCSFHLLGTQGKVAKAKKIMK